MWPRPISQPSEALTSGPATAIVNLEHLPTERNLASSQLRTGRARHPRGAVIASQTVHGDSLHDARVQLPSRPTS